MPKAEKGSVKDIANRMKARGLQKLKFYCQMCEKQCRDANGFKCHIQSESHLRQMKIFGDNAGGFLQQYSNEFEKAFLTNLRMRHGTKKVNANNVYQEVIADKQHIHMNATVWTTLTDFVQYLGKTKKCLVEENHTDGNGGWMVSYIERDAGILARKEALQRREASDKRAEEALLERMKIQRLEAARALEKATGGTAGRVEATSIGDTTTTAPIKMGLATNKAGSASSTKNNKTPKRSAAFGDDEDDEDEDENDTVDAAKPKASHTTNVEGIIHETRTTAAPDRSEPRKRRHGHTEIADGATAGDTSRKRSKGEGSTESKSISKSKSKSSSSKDGWLYRDILVRVISEGLEGGKYFRKKAAVDKVLGDGFAAEVEILGDRHSSSSGAGDVLRLDQSDLETVVPKRARGGDKVRILRGKHRGKKATVKHLDKAHYRADLVVVSKRKDSDDGKLLRDVPYEDFSKVA